MRDRIVSLKDNALNFIGIGEDKFLDVAEEHDKYLDEAYIC